MTPGKHTSKKVNNMENNEEQPVEVIEDKPMSGFSRLLSEPLSKHGWPVWLVYLL